MKAIKRAVRSIRWAVMSAEKREALAGRADQARDLRLRLTEAVAKYQHYCDMADRADSLGFTTAYLKAAGRRDKWREEIRNLSGKVAALKAIIV